MIAQNSSRYALALLVSAWCFDLGLSAAQATEYLPGIKWPEPTVVTPGKQNSLPPSDAVVLFDGPIFPNGKTATHGRSSMA